MPNEGPPKIPGRLDNPDWTQGENARWEAASHGQGISGQDIREELGLEPAVDKQPEKVEINPQRLTNRVQKLKSKRSGRDRKGGGPPPHQAREDRENAGMIHWTDQ